MTREGRLEAALKKLVSMVREDCSWLLDANCGGDVVLGDKINALLTSGGFSCPICGEDKPHHHSAQVVDAYQNKRARS